MKISVFTKIFAYTMMLLLLMCMAAVLLFARQFLSFYRDEQRRQLSASFEPMLTIVGDRDKSPEEIMEFARVFADRNQSYSFIIREGDGNVLFSTPDTNDLSEDEPDDGLRVRFMGMTKNLTDGPEMGYVFTGYSPFTNTIDYGDLVRRSLLALVIMLVIAIFGAILFAKRVTKPLEDEIIRERTMEENQRLFFSAASHELKTPIAAARALVEGMMAGIGDYKDHHKYLRECMNTLDSQARLVSEILDIVKLSDKEAAPVMGALDLREPGNSMLNEYRPLAELRGLMIEGEFPHVCVHADRGLLQRVLSNVMANAVQNTRECGIIRINSEKHKSLRLNILNTGAHISDEVISRLFEPFYRLDTARTRHDSQSGLGLAIVKKALDRMAIPFGLENTREGVLFWMDLPLCEEHNGKKIYRKTSEKIQR